ncbi:MAG: DUF2892 domain-containing protein [Bdellovibrionaceae bacterium]|nr:DUF2892 domain-containing protein [Pseudobdellovibrionaceae bacterium]NUM58573.1 DUF2892 domain-containing protein [Pseudobdellovibrionaceae bacterium]
MKCNLAYWDRVLRFILGVLTLSYAIAGGPPWFYLGGYLIFSSAWGFCGIYAFFRIKTLYDRSSSRFFSKK